MSSIRHRLLGFASGIVAGLGFMSAATAAEPVKVGILHSLTGTMTISEITLKDTILMLVDEQNKKSGVLGRPLEAVVVDPKSDWPTFATSAEKLLGEAGKGFAVVASEVKQLANQNARATDEISGQIDTIQAATSGAVDAIRHIGHTIVGIDEIAATIAAAVDQQAAATGEIARNVHEAAHGTTEVSRSIGDVTRAASETGDAAVQVLSASDDLTRQSDRLSREVETLIATIRAA